VNHIHLIRRLGADPSVTPYRDDKQPKDAVKPRRVFVQFDLAVERTRPNPSTGEIETDWVPVTLFDGPAARFAAAYLKKGNRVGLSGRLETGTYEADGRTKRRVFRVVADEVMGLDPRHGAPKGEAARGTMNSQNVVDFGAREAVR